MYAAIQTLTCTMRMTSSEPRECARQIYYSNCLGYTNVLNDVLHKLRIFPLHLDCSRRAVWKNITTLQVHKFLCSFMDFFSMGTGDIHYMDLWCRTKPWQVSNCTLSNKKLHQVSHQHEAQYLPTKICS